MEQRISFVTFGVKDLAKSRAFYMKLGWKPTPKSDDNICFFQAGAMVFGLYPWNHLADDVTVKPEGSGFRGVTLAHNVRTKPEVAKLLEEAQAAGGKIVKPAQDVFWGGHSGYFADPDGHYWEVAFNPFAEIKADGSIVVS